MKARIYIYFQVLWAAILGRPIVARMHLKNVTISYETRGGMIIGNVLEGGEEEPA